MDNRKALKQGDKVIVSDHCFSIQKEIGRGTSSIVYTAIDEKNQQKVILKELYPLKLVDVGRDDNNIIQVKYNQVFNFYQKRLSDALELQSKMHNDTQTNLTTSFCYFTDNIEFPYYCAMEWRIGSTLSYEIAFPEFLEVCWQLSEILQLYHKKGYLHLDIKPSNVFWDGQRISLFDFDSVFKTDEIQSGFVSYSPHYAAPEVRKFPERIDKNRTDIYAIGIMLFRRIFNRYPEDKETWAYFPYDYSCCEDKLSPELKEIINDIFHHTLISYIDGRFTAEELSKRLKKAVRVSEKKDYINSYELRPATNRDIAVKRTAELEQIKHFFLNGKKAVFLYGMGGTGKSELALQFAEKYSKQYAVMQKVGYFESLEKTIESIKISSDSAEFVKNQYEDVKKILSEISVDTLIIIDNYTFGEKDIEILTELVMIDNRHLNFIFTTRENQEQKLNLSNYIAFQNAEQLHTLRNDIAKMFFDITGEAFKSEYYQWAESFMENIQYHIMTIYILACQIKELDREFYHDYISLLDENGLSSDELNEDDNEMAVYRHIKTIFDMSSIKKSENELTVMINASLLPVDGMKEDEFIKLIGLKKGKFSTSPCQSLVMKSWLKREKRNGSSYISMHPLVAEICIDEFGADKYMKYCYPIIEKTYDRMSDSYHWRDPENEAYFQTVFSVIVARNMIKVIKQKNIDVSQNRDIIILLILSLGYCLDCDMIGMGIEACEKLMTAKKICKEEKYIIQKYRCILICEKNKLYFNGNIDINIFTETAEEDCKILYSAVEDNLFPIFDGLRYCVRVAEYLNTDEYIKSAMEYANMACRLRDTFTNFNTRVAVELINLGYILVNLGEIEQAFFCMKPVFDKITFFDSKSPSYIEISCLILMSHIFIWDYEEYHELNVKNEKEYALKYLLLALKQYTSWITMAEVGISKQISVFGYLIAGLVHIYFGENIPSDLENEEGEIEIFSKNSHSGHFEMNKKFFEELFFCIEKTYFDNRDYDMAVKYISLLNLSKSALLQQTNKEYTKDNIIKDNIIKDNIIKDNIIYIYRMCSNIYEKLGDKNKSELYEQRAKQIEADYENRKRFLSSL